MGPPWAHWPTSQKLASLAGRGIRWSKGAGKTSTLKLLSGLLYHASGEAYVLGFVPARREQALLRQITLLAGNRNQLVLDVPVGDSFEVNRAIYGVGPETYARTRDKWPPI